MGNFVKWCRGAQVEPVSEAPKVSKVTEADVVKSNLKKSRDYIQNFIDKKQAERNQLNELILKKYKQDKNKKALLPLLQTKKEISNFIQQSEVRITAINKTIRDVEMQQTTLETIKVLEDSNKFKQKIQDELEQMDWRGILEDAKEKYQGPQWEDEKEEDEDFQAIWKQLGGDKMAQLNVPQPVQVVVPKVIEVQQINEEKQRQVEYA